MMCKKAVLVVSFGTSYREVIDSCIAPVEKVISDALPEYDFYRAFTSRMIRNKLDLCFGVKIDDPVAALGHLKEAGYREVIIQPTHILAGTEYHQLKDQVIVFGVKNPEMKLIFGQPVLYENGDYEKAVSAILPTFPDMEKDTALILMGHGSEHFSNASYFALQHYLDVMTKGKVYVANVEAPPMLPEVIEKLKINNIKKVYLTPFMLVAGDHAKNDMAGEDEDSWKNILKKEDIETEIILKGLGEIEAFRELYRIKALRNID
ncbi:MAG: sirohydrochlorin cobaltochelatase [Clostridiales bacterium]|nr:sirohydrochlorin cobaltochelatase [Clostridiales bacterium]MDY3746501.1 sirohydrochlorin cobaltochelatase [Lachnospiraceae bacterium]